MRCPEQSLSQRVNAFLPPGTPWVKGAGFLRTYCEVVPPLALFEAFDQDAGVVRSCATGADFARWGEIIAARQVAAADRQHDAVGGRDRPIAAAGSRGAEPQHAKALDPGFKRRVIGGLSVLLAQQMQ